MRLFGAQGYQRLLQSAMEALDHPVRLGMIWSCDDGLDTPSSGQLLEDFGDELRAAVGCNGGGDAEGLYPSES